MTAGNPGFHRRRLGDLVVTAIFDGVVEIPLEACTNIPLSEARRLQDENLRPYPPMLPTSIFAITSGENTVVIDAGGAAELDAELGLGRARLIASGIDPASISSVLMTHLHTDHYGGLTLPNGSAAFPNADLVLHVDDHRHRFAGSEPPPDYLQRALAPYAERLRLVSAGSVMPGIEAIALPGHTPGHTGYLIGSGDERLLIWGDVVHLPAIQFAHPEVSLSYDVNGDLARISRQNVFARAASERLLVAGMHMDFPCFGHVVADGEAYRWIAEEPQKAV
jgi:glyoxylase-like metal-dependent hydrolase (beta-lactamase superfamily II)